MKGQWVDREQRRFPFFKFEIFDRHVEIKNTIWKHLYIHINNLGMSIFIVNKSQNI